MEMEQRYGVEPPDQLPPVYNNPHSVDPPADDPIGPYFLRDKRTTDTQPGPKQMADNSGRDHPSAAPVGRFMNTWDIHPPVDRDSRPPVDRHGPPPTKDDPLPRPPPPPVGPDSTSQDLPRSRSFGEWIEQERTRHSGINPPRPGILPDPRSTPAYSALALVDVTIPSHMQDWLSGKTGDVQQGCTDLPIPVLESLGIQKANFTKIITLRHAASQQWASAILQTTPTVTPGPNIHAINKRDNWPELASLQKTAFYDFYGELALTLPQYGITLTPFNTIDLRYEHFGLCTPGLSAISSTWLNLRPSSNYCSAFAPTVGGAPGNSRLRETPTKGTATNFSGTSASL